MDRSKRTIKPPTRFVEEDSPTITGVSASSSPMNKETPLKLPQSKPPQKNNLKLAKPGGETLKIKLPFKPKRPSLPVTPPSSGNQSSKSESTLSASSKSSKSGQKSASSSTSKSTSSSASKPVSGSASKSTSSGPTKHASGSTPKSSPSITSKFSSSSTSKPAIASGSQSPGEVSSPSNSPTPTKPADPSKSAQKSSSKSGKSYDFNAQKCSGEKATPGGSSTKAGAIKSSIQSDKSSEFTPKKSSKETSKSQKRSSSGHIAKFLACPAKRPALSGKMISAGGSSPKPMASLSPEKQPKQQQQVESIPIDVALLKPARPRTPPQFLDVAPNTVLPFWDARTAAEEHEDDNVKELVHCKCDLIEESGLMVQCETCLTWQHGNCLNIQSEQQVPDGYTCFACANPKLPRESQRYKYTQEWLMKGKLKLLFNLGNSSDDNEQESESQKEIRDRFVRINKLADSVFEVTKVIGALKAQSKILKDSTSSESQDDLAPELKYWKRCWLDETGNDVIPTSGVLTSDYDVETCRSNLAAHINVLTRQVEEKLESIETKVAQIENDLCMFYDEKNNDIQEIRTTLNCLFKDLNSALTTAESRPTSTIKKQSNKSSKTDVNMDIVATEQDESRNITKSDCAIQDQSPCIT